jgi:glycosyltransferase involved in cell wall biosynthesis
MKFLYHHRTFANDGSAVHIDGLVGALRDLGHVVIVIGPVIAKRDVGAVGGDFGGRLRRALPRWLYELGELTYNLPEWLRLQAAIARHRPDVIYQRYNLYLFSGQLAAKVADVPIIQEVNSPLFEERMKHGGGLSFPRFARAGERWVWRSADAVVAVTNVLADIVQRDRTAGRWTLVMPNGVDLRVFGERRAESCARSAMEMKGRLVIGFTGFVRAWNGLEAVIDMLPELPQEVTLMVVGDGPACVALKARAGALGVGGRVKFCGLVPRESVADHVAAFDIALQPAANAYASPLKLFEYMAMRRAIIAPDQANLREILEDGHNALLFDPAKPGSMKEAIVRLVGDAALRSRLADAALRTLGERQLTWRRNAERVHELAQHLIASSHASDNCKPRSAPRP